MSNSLNFPQKQGDSLGLFLGVPSSGHLSGNRPFWVPVLPFSQSWPQPKKGCGSTKKAQMGQAAGFGSSYFFFCAMLRISFATVGLSFFFKLNGGAGTLFGLVLRGHQRGHQVRFPRNDATPHISGWLSFSSFPFTSPSIGTRGRRRNRPRWRSGSCGRCHFNSWPSS